MTARLFLLTLLIIIIQLRGISLHTLSRGRHELTPRQLALQLKSNELDKYYSGKKLGAFVDGNNTTFRLFAPQAASVVLCLFSKPEQKTGEEYNMTRDEQGVWEAGVKGKKYGWAYGFKIYRQKDAANTEPPVCLDPYAKAVASNNTYMGERRGIVMREDDYHWGSDQGVRRDWRDLIIYEMHVRDMTAHPSSGVKQRGTYMGLVEKGKQGGFDYIKNLGVNAVELLPAMEFANIEIPFKKELNGKLNTWNPYERNHWGYMTSSFFAPDAYYAVPDGKLRWKSWEGTDGKQVRAFKDMVKAFHKAGIAVIMDVVYNHLSEYETGNLKQIDQEYYFRADNKGNFTAVSGCGNDLKTERPMLRRLIIESILFWMKEYHIDGFRFDLGKMIDWTTIEDIIREAKKINPDVIFVCEPWGGGYDPMGFSMRGWGAWNDQIRNGIKGENPDHGLGWLFGKWYGNNSPRRIQSYVNGTLSRDTLGLFQKKEHSVNYLESHDGYTLGDFIRIAAREVDPSRKFHSADSLASLSPLQLKLNKLAAAFLLTAQGIAMIHEGQEFARSKVIPLDTGVPDPNKGHIDHNSYEKDNETNYLNFTHAKLNTGLVDYYKGLIKLRTTYAAFRRAEYDEVKFFPQSANHFALGYTITHNGEQFVCLFNAHPTKAQDFTLPEGNYDILVNESNAGIKSLGKAAGVVTLSPSTARIFKRKID